jgi:hypothetical protein
MASRSRRAWEAPQRSAGFPPAPSLRHLKRHTSITVARLWTKRLSALRRFTTVDEQSPVRVHGAGRFDPGRRDERRGAVRRADSFPTAQRVGGTEHLNIGQPDGDRSNGRGVKRRRTARVPTRCNPCRSAVVEVISSALGRLGARDGHVDPRVWSLDGRVWIGASVNIVETTAVAVETTGALAAIEVRGAGRARRRGATTREKRDERRQEPLVHRPNRDRMGVAVS